VVDYRQQLGGQRVQVHLVAEPAAERGDRAGGVIAAAGWLEHCRYRQGRGRHDQAGVAAQQLPKPQHDRGVGASQQDREQQVGERAADDAVQVVEAIAQVNVLIDGLSPTPGAHRYRAAYPSATPKQLRETALSDWLYRMPAPTRRRSRRPRCGARVWLYEPCWGFGPRGASHGLDTLLLCGTADVDGEVTTAGPAAVAAAEQLSQLIRAEHLAFATTGDPG